MTDQLDSQSSTPEQIKEYQMLKARNEWIRMNEKYLKEIERKRLRYHRIVVLLLLSDIALTLIQLLL